MTRPNHEEKKRIATELAAIMDARAGEVLEEIDNLERKLSYTPLSELEGVPNRMIARTGKDGERVGYENTGHKSFDGRGRKNNSRGHKNFVTHRR